MRTPSRSFVFGCFTGIILAIVIAVCGTLGIVYGFKNHWIKMTAEKLKAPPITTGLKADFNWNVIAPDGAPYDLEQLKGKTVLLNFWNPECVHCLAEIGALNRLYAQTEGQDIRVLGIVTEDEERLAATIQKEGICFPVFSYKGTLPEVFQTTSRPATFIIAPDGTIVFKHLGGARWDDPSVLALLNLAGQQYPAATP